MANGYNFKKLGEFFREYRLKKGLSQTQLAQKLGFGGPQIISNWERGECAPPLKSMVSMTTLLGIPKSEVLDMLVEENKLFLEKTFAKGGRKSVR